MRSNISILIAAFVIAVFGVAMTGPTAGAALTLSRDATFSNTFTVDIFPSVARVEIDDLVMPKVPGSLSSDGRWRTYQPGQPQPLNITMEINSGDDQANAADWFRDTVRGQGRPRDMNISLRDSGGNVVRSYTFYGCMPVGYTPLGADPLPSSSPAASFSLKLTCQRVQIAGAFTGDTGDSYWSSISGGALDVSSAGTALVSGDQYRTSTVEPAEISELTLTGPAIGRRARAFPEWLEAILQGREVWRTVVLQAINREGGDAGQLEYRGCFITRYVFPKLDRATTEQQAVEGFVIHANETDLNYTRIGTPVRGSYLETPRSYRVEIGN